MTFLAAHAIPRILDGIAAELGAAAGAAGGGGMWVFLFRTYRGLQMQVGGLAPAAARYAGFSSRRRCGRRCWCPAALPAWPGRWRWPARWAS
jgi:ABC-type uncharacterized transport system permease subunit